MYVARNHFHSRAPAIEGALEGAIAEVRSDASLNDWVLCGFKGGEDIQLIGTGIGGIEVSVLVAPRGTYRLTNSISYRTPIVYTTPVRPLQKKGNLKNPAMSGVIWFWPGNATCSRAHGKARAYPTAHNALLARFALVRLPPAVHHCHCKMQEIRSTWRHPA